MIWKLRGSPAAALSDGCDNDGDYDDNQYSPKHGQTLLSFKIRLYTTTRL